MGLSVACCLGLGSGRSNAQRSAGAGVIHKDLKPDNLVPCEGRKTGGRPQKDSFERLQREMLCTGGKRLKLGSKHGKQPSLPFYARCASEVLSKTVPWDDGFLCRLDIGGWPELKSESRKAVVPKVRGAPFSLSGVSSKAQL